jgi:hypothetical protein
VQVVGEPPLTVIDAVAVAGVAPFRGPGDCVVVRSDDDTTLAGELRAVGGGVETVRGALDVRDVTTERIGQVALAVTVLQPVVSTTLPTAPSRKKHSHQETRRRLRMSVTIRRTSA